ncbi:MAG: tetratricopeptide repeat protein, partial [Thermoanaerobaculia bacterium]|nr:tetratricopeptide repeat protein [Thermoanaerobaculia bacterium]
RMWSDHRIGLEIYQSEEPALLMLGIPSADLIHHLFGPFHPPFRRGVDTGMRDRYWPVVTNFYVEIDRLLGEWNQVATEDTTLILVSAYGHRWDEDRPIEMSLDRPDLTSHREQGVFIAAGHRVDPSRSLREIDLLDVAPTVLTLLGLPVAEEMQGEPVSDLFADLRPVETVSITSYSDVIDLDRTGTRPSVSADEYEESLRIAGHIVERSDRSGRASEVQTERGEDWGMYAWLNNRGVELAAEGDSEQAISSLEKAIELSPDRHVPYINLAMIALESQRFSSAEALVWKAIEAGVPDPEALILDLAAWYRTNNYITQSAEFLEDAHERYPESYEIVSNLGSALAASERYTDAIPLLEEALAMRPTATQVLNNLGVIYAEREDYGRALDYWNRSLEIAPRQPRISAAIRAAARQL